MRTAEVRWLFGKAALTAAVACLPWLVSAADVPMVLWDRAPTKDWYRGAYPVGNGHLGAMTFGGTERCEIQLNEITLWTGGPNTGPKFSGGNNPGAAAALPEVRALLYEGKVKEANAVVPKLLGNNIGWSGYQNLGSMFIDFEGKAKTDKPADYRRELALDTATSSVTYRNAGVTFTQTVFASNPGNIIAVRLTASEKDALAFRLSLKPDDRRDPYGRPGKSYTLTASDGVIDCLGTVTTSKMKFAAGLRVIAPTADITAAKDGSLTVKNGEDVLILFSAGTNYDIREGQNIHEIADFHTPDGDWLDNSDPDGLKAQAGVRDRLSAAAKLPYAALLKRHIRDFRSLYGRSSVNLGDEQDIRIPTCELLKAYRGKKRFSRYLETLTYSYGRYLLISSSRDAVLPTNLQGLWCCSNNPPWAGDYHLNVNLQMNYWPAFVTNIAPVAEPLLSLLNALRNPANLTARIHFGVNEGWVLNTQATPFGMTSVGWQFRWGWTPGCGAWICNNLWDYYRFTQSRDVLERVYPILKGAALFWQHYLQRHPKTGEWVACPSASSEHGPAGCGTTYDMTLAYMLFSDTVEAADLLGTDRAWADELRAILKDMHPIRLGADGQIKEWREEVRYCRDADGKLIGDPTHRHISHLMGLYPGNIISTEDSTLRAAAKRTLDLRGSRLGFGWPPIQRSLCRARIGEGELAYAPIRNYLVIDGWDNLLNSYRPHTFQIDSNLGYTAAIAEMLIQSHVGILHLLPTMPEAWKSRGSFRGLCGRGNFEVDLAWKNGTVVSGEIRSGSGRDCRLRFPGMDRAQILHNGRPVSVKRVGNSLAFPTEKGGVYTLKIN